MRVSHALKTMDTGYGFENGAIGVLADGVVGFGTSYGLGQVYHRYGEKWAGRNAPRIVAAVGKLGAAIMGATMGAGIATGMVNSFGQAGLNAVGLDLGLRHARKSTGLKAALVPKDTDLKKIAGAREVTSIGALGKAQPGRGLSWDQIEELAAGH